MNESYEHSKAALIAEVNAAFDGVSREGGVSLHESYVIDDYGSEAQRLEARKLDTEMRWQDVPDEDIAAGDSCLSFLDEIGFRYYIPAYIVWSLHNMDDEDPELPGYDSNSFASLIYALTPHFHHVAYGLPDDGNGSGQLADFSLARFRMFTSEQAKTIARFLVFAAERENESKRESEQGRQEMLRNDGWTQEQIDEAKRESEQYRIELDLPENSARRALERYWGQFL